MAIFTGMVLQAEGQTQIYEQSLDISWPEAAQDVASVTHGYVGVAMGPQQCVIQISNTVLAAQARFDFQKNWREGAEVNIRCFQLGDDKALQGRFIVKTCSLGTGNPGAPTIENATLTSVGTPAPIFE